MKKVALITLHGMGKIKSHYFAELAAGLAQRLGNEWHDVAFRNVQYQPELQGPQDALWEEMSECEDNQLDGVKLRPARVAWQNADQLRFVLREGRKRQIRRMCELVGLEVTGLKRVRSGNVPLGGLPPGQWRYLRQDEQF